MTSSLTVRQLWVEAADNTRTFRGHDSCVRGLQYRIKSEFYIGAM